MGHRIAVISGALITLSSTALAQTAPAPDPSMVPTAPTAPTAPAMPSATADAAPAPEGEKKEPKRGDFDAGGVLRLPSGPDEMGKYASWNWVAVDAVGRYFLLDGVTVNAKMPLAVHKPDMIADGDPRLIGGVSMTLDAKLGTSASHIGVVLTGAYMREGAMLLSDKDFPRFVGDFQPGVSTGVVAKLKLGSLLDFALTPVWVRQSGAEESLEAVQIPMATTVKLGSLLKVSADLGIFTGDDYSFSGDDGGRISAGGSVTVKLGPILAHAGAGVASLLTGGLYPEVGDSVYIDLNVKYAK